MQEQQAQNLGNGEGGGRGREGGPGDQGSLAPATHCQNWVLSLCSLNIRSLLGFVTGHLTGRTWATDLGVQETYQCRLATTSSGPQMGPGQHPVLWEPPPSPARGSLALELGHHDGSRGWGGVPVPWAATTKDTHWLCRRAQRLTSGVGRATPPNCERGPFLAASSLWNLLPALNLPRQPWAFALHVACSRGSRRTPVSLDHSPPRDLISA